MIGRTHILGWPLFAGAMLLLANSLAAIEVPYESYTYDWWGYPTRSPHAYVPATVITGDALGIGSLDDPLDLFATPDGLLFLLDSGNNRIVVLDDDFKLLRVVSGFDHNGELDTFSRPEGLFVDDRGHVFVADTGNERVVELDGNDDLVGVYPRPETELLNPNAAYEPQKIVLDRARRMYLIVRGVNRGLVELDSDGRFRGFMGANLVTPNALDYIWKLISTDAQRARMERFVPTEYSNATIDPDGYIYVTTASVGTDLILESINPEDLMAVRRLNLTGTDVLRTLDDQWPPVGDISIGIGFGGLPSQFVDIALGPAETYATLDRTRGRIFYYNSDGILLVAFGGTGERFGSVRGPAALEFAGDRLVALDSILNQVVVFRPTEYGRTLIAASQHYYDRNYDESAEAWRQASEMNTNLEVAYAGVGKAELRVGDYQNAMESFRLAHVPSYYSKAFTLYRREWVEEHFSLIVGIPLLGAALIVVARVVRKRRRNQ